MREIKFRAWDKEKKRMRHPEILVANNKDLDIWRFYDEMNELPKLPPKRDIVLMQYTGLKDKNGKEIYEGDILRWFVKDLENIGWVVYEEYDTAFSCKVIKPVQNIWVKLNAFDYEIIGDVYRNPELLKEKKG